MGQFSLKWPQLLLYSPEKKENHFWLVSVNDILMNPSQNKKLRNLIFQKWGVCVCMCSYIHHIFEGGKEVKDWRLVLFKVVLLLKREREKNKRSGGQDSSNNLFPPADMLMRVLTFPLFWVTLRGLTRKLLLGNFLSIPDSLNPLWARPALSKYNA